MIIAVDILVLRNHSEVTNINFIKNLIKRCLDEQNPNLAFIRRRFSFIFFELILFLALNSPPQLYPKIFREQGGI
jgi:hypothetical protein